MISRNEFATSVTEFTSPTADDLRSRIKFPPQPFILSGAEPVYELKLEQRSYAVPWFGLATLIISILTVITSWLILQFIKGRPIFTDKLLKAAVSYFLWATGFGFQVLYSLGIPRSFPSTVFAYILN
jgi:hypothetical protein